MAQAFSIFSPCGAVVSALVSENTLRPCNCSPRFGSETLIQVQVYAKCESSTSTRKFSLAVNDVGVVCSSRNEQEGKRCNPRCEVSALERLQWSGG